jgi:hypothetical protein
VILFRRHVIYGPEAAIPPEFERGEIRDVEGSETLNAWHGFMPVDDVEGVLIDALHHLRAIEKLTGDWETRATADDIERMLNRWEQLQEEYEDGLAHPFGVPS